MYYLYLCDVERDCPQADDDEPAGDWATSHDSVHDVLVNKKSNAMLVFILFSTEENLMFIKVLILAPAYEITGRFKVFCLFVCVFFEAKENVTHKLNTVVTDSIPISNN